MMTTVQPGVMLMLPEAAKRGGGILGCINENDGSGYIHALLNAYHPGYSKNKSPYYRTHLAKSVRVGAIPEIIKQHGEEEEAREIFDEAIAFGTPLSQFLLKDYATFLNNAPYILYDSNLEVIEEFNNGKRKCCRIVNTSDDQYHLLVKGTPEKYAIIW